MLILLVLLAPLLPTPGARADLASQVKDLLGLLQTPEPPTGEPWPKVPGPGKQDQVCIVGAGPAGVHMALSLKQRNYTRVVVLEKSNRVGGKNFDITYNGVYQPFGTLLLEANYFANLIPLARQYGLGEVVEVPPAEIWTENSASQPGSNISQSAFFLGSISKLTKSSSPQDNLAAFLEASVRYVRLHKSMFGNYEGDLMEKPSPRVLYRVRGTFLQFLQRENLTAMAPVFRISVTVGGYGHLEETSALYGLMWNNPKLVVSLVLRAIKQGKEPFNIYILKNGFEKIWKTIVEKEALNVQYNIDLVGVQKSQNGVDLHIWHDGDSTVETKPCQFLVWTAPMSELLKVLQFPTRQQKQLFSTLQHEIYTASLINTVNPIRHGAYTVYTANLLGNQENRVHLDYDIAGMLTPGITTAEGLEMYNKGKGVTTRICLQLNKKLSSEAELNRRLRDHYIQGFNSSEVEILATKSFKHFPRWSPQEMTQAPHWNVFAMQGQGRIWYAGSSVSFESVRSVMEYNNLLLRQMVEPGRVARNKPFSVETGLVRGQEEGERRSDTSHIENGSQHITQKAIIK